MSMIAIANSKRMHIILNWDNNFHYIAFELEHSKNINEMKSKSSDQASDL